MKALSLSRRTALSWLGGATLWHLTSSALAKASGSPYPNTLDHETESRIGSLLTQMTLTEKLGQLVQYNDVGVAATTAADGDALQAFNPDAETTVDPLALAANGGMGSMLNIVGAEKTRRFQRAAVEDSRLGIPLLFGADILHGYRTIYPIPLGLAATWDADVVEQVSAVAAAEATTAGVRWFYSPMVDVSRDARWGRVAEGAGEDPYLGAEMAAAYVRGYQGKNLADPQRVAATLKHFAAYGAAEAGREYNTTDMSDRQLREVYLPPFRRGIDAGAATVMTAFNALNGVPATADHYLLNDILRDEWGFGGVVVSDYTAVKELLNHGVAVDPAEAAKKAFMAGTDIDMMSNFFDRELPELIARGEVPMAAIDAAVRRILRVKFALGLFDDPYVQGREVTAAVPAHRPAVREAAEKSFVLLQNKPLGGQPLLPLSARYKRVALIGPLADSAVDMLGPWSGSPKREDVVTLKSALAKRISAEGVELHAVKGLAGVDVASSDSTETDIAAAVAAARDADVVIMALGESGQMSGEATSRTELELPGQQQRLLEAVHAAGTPIVLLVFSGRPLVLEWAADHVPAIMAVWFPGTEAGHALVRTLYGDVSPSGKLPMCFPRNVGQLPLYYGQLPTGRPANNSDYGPSTGGGKYVSRYIDSPNSPRFVFGHGLNYTEFHYSNLRLSRQEVGRSGLQGTGNDEVVRVTVTLANRGNSSADEVAQLYVGITGVSLSQPVKSLKGYQRVFLRPGEQTLLSFSLSVIDLSTIGQDGAASLAPGRYRVWVAGSSRVDDAVMASFQILD